MNNVIHFEDVTFNKGSQIIRGRLYMPDQYKKKLPLIIFAHGFGSCFNELEHYGPVIAEAGMACLLFDFCGGSLIGKSDGSMDDMSILTEVEDLKVVIAGVTTFEEIDKTAIFLMGESLGGLVATYVAASCDLPVRGLILWYPGFNVVEDCKRRSHMIGLERYDFFENLKITEKFINEGKNLNIKQAMTDFKSPVQIIHGDQDDVVPIVTSKEAVSYFKDAELLIIPGAVHGFEDDECKIAIETSIKFVHDTLTVLK